MLLFVSIFFITNIGFSLVLGSLLLRLNSDSKLESGQILLHSLGLGPVFTTLVIYYSFLLMPNHSSIFYLTVIVSLYLIIATFGRKDFGPMLSFIFYSPQKLLIPKSDVFSRIEHILFLFVIFTPIIVFLIAYFTQILQNPLIGLDILDYGITGKMLFEAKSLTPIWTENFAQNGYLYKITAAPSFSLLLTWEQMVNSLFHVNSDLYFRSIGAYYGVLIVAVQFHWIAKENKWLAVLSSIALVSGLGFYLKFFFPHIDTYRIFFIIMSFLYLAHAVKNPDMLSIILFGMFSGFAAYTHRIGVVIAAINWGVFFIMMECPFKPRIFKASAVIILILAAGGSHYIFDLLLGQGIWIQNK